MKPSVSWRTRNIPIICAAQNSKFIKPSAFLPGTSPKGNLAAFCQLAAWLLRLHGSTAVTIALPSETIKPVTSVVQMPRGLYVQATVPRTLHMPEHCTHRCNNNKLICLQWGSRMSVSFFVLLLALLPVHFLLDGQLPGILLSVVEALNVVFYERFALLRLVLTF